MTRRPVAALTARLRGGGAAAAAIGAAAALALAAFGASEVVRLRPLPAIYDDGKGGPLRAPEGVGCRDATLAVADTGNGRILLYTLGPDGHVEAVAEVKAKEVPVPIQVQITARGDLLALDGRSRRIARVSRAGAFQGYVEPQGEAAGAIVPRAFRLTGSDAVVILDVAHARILVLSPEGKPQRSIAYPKEVGFLSDLALDGPGAIFALDSTGRRVFVARKDDQALSLLTGAFRDEVAFPTALAVDPLGRLCLLDRGEGGLVFLGADGAFRGRPAGTGWKEGLLRYPSGVCAGAGGLLAVADRGNSRVQIFAVPE